MQGADCLWTSLSVGISEAKGLAGLRHGVIGREGLAVT